MRAEFEKMSTMMAITAKRTNADTLFAMLSNAENGEIRVWSCLEMGRFAGIAGPTAYARFTNLKKAGLIESCPTNTKRVKYRVSAEGVVFTRINFRLIKPERIEQLDPAGHARRLLGVPVAPPRTLSPQPSPPVQAATSTNGKPARKKVNGRVGRWRGKDRPAPSERRAAVLRMVRVCGGHGDADYMVRITTSDLIERDKIAGDLKWLKDNNWIEPNRLHMPDKEDITTWYWFAIS